MNHECSSDGIIHYEIFEKTKTSSVNIEGNNNTNESGNESCEN